MPPKIMFVCLGNICRSPTAEGVFRGLAGQAGLDVIVDSSGTGGWHVGGTARSACDGRGGITRV